MIKILVTGAKGQLGQSLLPRLNNKIFEVVYTDRETLDISDAKKVNTLFKKEQFNYCINAAAYTNVDGAEKDKASAFLINAEAVKLLADACLATDCVLIHISTDFVFDGMKKEAYTEQDPTNPVNIYGQSKLQGEEFIKEVLNQYFIIRTSWLYSEFGKNFFRTMTRLADNNKEINVVDDQWGCPTYAGDLADFIVELIHQGFDNYGVYHFSNNGLLTWYEFAKTIFRFQGLKIKINPIPSFDYPTQARRPAFSKLDNTLLGLSFGYEMKDWKESLKTCLSRSQISS